MLVYQRVVVNCIISEEMVKSAGEREGVLEGSLAPHRGSQANFGAPNM